MRTASAIIFAIGASALVAPIPSAVSQDIELPARKPGQWEIKMVAETPGAAPDMTIVACVDAASDAEMMRAGLSMTKQMCPQQDMRREGDTIVIDAICKIGPMDTKSQSVITGDFQSAYTVVTTIETTGGLAAMAGTNVAKQEARWVSAECSDGLKPGDMLMPGGMKTNVKDMMKMIGGG
jgi:hypothetical protein